MSAPIDPALALLTYRARQLAKPLDLAGIAATRDTSSLLVVRIADERIGLELEHVLEVHRAAMLTPIPAARSPVVGVVAWRGRVLTVLDIAAARSGPVSLTDSTRIVVLGQHRAVFGIIADAVDDAQDVNLADVAPTEDVAESRRAFVRGALPDALVVIDAAALMAHFAPSH